MAYTLYNPLLYIPEPAPYVPVITSSARTARVGRIPQRRNVFQSVPPVPLAPQPSTAIPTIITPSRRLSGLRIVRRSGWLPTAPISLASIPGYTEPVRRAGASLPRRGIVRQRPWFEPAGSAPVVPAFIRRSGFRPKWAPLPRRGQFSSALLVGLAPPAPAVPLGNVTRNPRCIALVRHGRFFTVIPAALPISSASTRRSRNTVSIRRGAFLPVTSAPRPASSWVPSPIQARRVPALAARRGAFQPVSIAPAIGPAMLARHSRIPLWVRRGVFQVVPLVTQTPPQIIRSIGARVLASRRGRFAVLPLTSAAPPRWYRCTRPVPGTRRGQFGSPPWIKPTGPGPLRPSILRATRRYPGLPFRRGRFIQGIVPPQEVFLEPVAGPGTTVPLAVAISRGTTIPLAVANPHQ